YSRSVPFISMHGTEDGTVPYATRVINLNDLTPLPAEPAVPIIEVKGSYDMDKYSDEKGYSHKFYTWYGADHVPYISFQNSDTGAMYMDTLMQFTVKYVYEDFLGLGTVDGIEENEPPCDFNNGVRVPCSQTSVEENNRPLQQLLVYPNPAKTELHFNLHGNNGAEIKIMEVTGKTVFKQKIGQPSVTLDASNWNRGVYFLRSTDGLGNTITQKVILNN
ncbi:MAG: T9SS type A sorting domain-containing protein, partial [Luteibaculum sp.]